MTTRRRHDVEVGRWIARFGVVMSWLIIIGYGTALLFLAMAELTGLDDVPWFAYVCLGFGFLIGVLLRIMAGRFVGPARCADCGRRYGDEHGFPDLVVPNQVWQLISPTGHEGGLLCPSCICKRAHDLGLSDVPARFTSGPFCVERRLGF